MNKKFITLLSCFIIFTANVFSQTPEWEKARKKNTIKSYTNFIKKYPDSEFRYAAFELIDSLYWYTQVINSGKNENYISYLKEFPNGRYVEDAGNYLGFTISEARIQIDKFNKAFGKSVEFTKEQVITYIEGLVNEKYSMVIDMPLEYYEITGDNCTEKRITKVKVVIEPSLGQKACSLHLEAGNLSLTAIYISNRSLNRALFARKWDHTIVHNGCAGPGLEFTLSSDNRRKEFENFLKTFSISYRLMRSTSGGFLGVVIPDLVLGSDKNESRYPHRGAEFTINHNNRAITFKVEGVNGMPDNSIETYKEALALKTYLKIINNE